MDAIRNMMTRQSVRSFTQEAISKEDLQTIIDCALASPTGKNLQNRLFTVLTKKEDIEKLAKVMKRALNREKYDFFNPNVLILVTVPRDSDLGESDCAIALENIYLAAHALDLGSVWINQLRQCQEDEEVRNVLTSFGIPKDHISYGMSAIGHIGTRPAVKERTETVIII